MWAILKLWISITFSLQILLSTPLMPHDEYLGILEILVIRNNDTCYTYCLILVSWYMLTDICYFLFINLIFTNWYLLPWYFVKKSFKIILHHFHSQLLFTTFVLNICSKLWFTTFVHNICRISPSQIFFVAMVHKCCPHFLFIFTTRSTSKELYTTRSN